MRNTFQTLPRCYNVDLSQNELEVSYMREINSNSLRKGEHSYSYHSEPREVRKRQISQKNLGTFSSEFELEIYFWQSEPFLEKKVSPNLSAGKKHFQDARKLSFGIDNSKSIKDSSTSRILGSPSSQNNFSDDFSPKPVEPIDWVTPEKDSKKMTSLNNLHQSSTSREQTITNSVIKDSTEQNNNQFTWWRGKNEYKLTENSEMTAGEFYPKKYYRELDVAPSKQKGDSNQNHDTEFFSLVTPKKRESVQYIYYSKESETSEHPDPLTIPDQEYVIDPLALNTGLNIPNEEHEYFTSKTQDPVINYESTKSVQSLPLQFKSQELNIDFGDSKDLQAPSNTQRGAISSDSSPPWKSKRSNKGSSRDKKWWLEYLKKFSHLHYEKTFNGFEELQRDIHQVHAPSGSHLHMPHVTPFSIKEHEIFRENTQINQPLTARILDLSKGLDMLSSLLMSHQHNM